MLKKWRYIVTEAFLIHYYTRYTVVLFPCVYAWSRVWVHVCIQVHVHMLALCGGQRLMLCVFNRSLPYIFEAGSLTWTSSLQVELVSLVSLLRTSASASQCWDYMWAITWVLWVRTTGRAVLEQQTTYLLNHLSSPRMFYFNYSKWGQPS